MIHIKRSAEVPRAFNSDAIRSDMAKYEEFYGRSSTSRSQENSSESIHGDTRETLEAIAVAFKYKCAACERSLKINEVISDSWRPRQNAKGLDNEFANEHYWWLSYEWQNKYLLCPDCNTFKGTWFPVEGQRSPIRTPYQTIIETEEALLIDPCQDYPEQHMYVSPQTGKLYPLSKKGEVTIEILKLNRAALLKQRIKTVGEVASMIGALVKIWPGANSVPAYIKRPVAEELMAIVQFMGRALVDHPQREHVMVWRQLVINWLSDHPAYRNPQSFTIAFSNGLKSSELSECLNIIASFDSIFDEKRNAGLSYRVTAICAPVSDYLGNMAPKDAVTKSLPRSQDGSEMMEKQTPKKRSLENIKKEPVLKQASWSDHVSQKTGLVRLYPEKVEVSNFKSISSLSFGFKIRDPNLKTFGSTPPVAKEPWKFLLGENGVGKSSLLQAISLVLCGDPYIRSLEIDPSDILKHGTKEGYVKIWFVGSPEPATLQFNSKELFCNFPSGSINVLGYGSTRVMPKANTSLQPESTSSPVKVRNLFDYSVSLADATAWLRGIDQASFDQAAKALKDVLDLPSVETYFIREKNSIYFSRNRETLDQLSEGYRSVIALSVDIMKTLSEVQGMKKSDSRLSYEVMEGIVLIDEISSHLHPRWQMKIVKAFRKAFPKLQFIVTSHDPLSLKGIESGEVLLLKRDERNEVISIGNLPDPSSLRAEQLLTSEFFGLNSTLDPDLELLFNTYHSLLALSTRTEAEEKMLNDLQLELKDKGHLGDTLREELMYKAIDESLANYSMPGNKEGREELFRNTKQKLTDIWDNLYKK